MKSASRTLVKSQPELWELIDQPDRMQGLMSGLLGRAAEVTVSKREPESILRWEAAGDEEQAWIKVKLAEKGWGTHVEVSASKAKEPWASVDFVTPLSEFSSSTSAPAASTTASGAGRRASVTDVHPRRRQCR